MNTIQLYSEDTSDNLLNSLKERVRQKIESEPEDYILNVGETQYTEHIKGEFQLDFPDIKTDSVYLDTYITEIPGENFPAEFYIPDRSKNFKKDIIVYNIPYEGNIYLLKFRPRTWNTGAGRRIKIEDREHIIKLEFINFYNDTEKIKSSYEESIRAIFSCYNSLKNEISDYNNTIENLIISLITLRRQQILQKSNFLSSLGIPLKKKQDTSDTFAVPKPKLRDKIVVRPVVSKSGFKPEPTLDLDNYQKILRLINDVGKNFERLPSVYSDKREEDLRDHILVTLDPNFEFGSASGETFNKSGKTDIQLRFESSVVFIAECKFWAGEKKYLETIDQLLGYLTWRDSKTSIIIFVRNKEIIPVIETILESTRHHSCFIREMPKSEESWFNYVFSLPSDRNKEIKMAVQIFHIP